MWPITQAAWEEKHTEKRCRKFLLMGGGDREKTDTSLHQTMTGVILQEGDLNCIKETSVGNMKEMKNKLE